VANKLLLFVVVFIILMLLLIRILDVSAPYIAFIITVIILWKLSYKDNGDKPPD